MVAISTHPTSTPAGFAGSAVAPPRRSPARPAVAPSPRLRLVGERPPVAVVRVQRVPRFLLSLVLAVVAVLATVALMVSEPLAEAGTIPLSDTTHVVADGETMWSIALDVAPAGEAATYVERLVAVNGGAMIVPGQVLTLPVP